MPRAFVKQPNGRYAIWSTVVDAFVAYDCTAAEAVQHEMESPFSDGYPGGLERLRNDLLREFGGIEVDGRAWRWAPTWDEAIQTMRDLHGDEKADEMLRLVAESERERRETKKAPDTQG